MTRALKIVMATYGVGGTLLGSPTSYSPNRCPNCREQRQSPHI